MESAWHRAQKKTANLSFFFIFLNFLHVKKHSFFCFFFLQKCVFALIYERFVIFIFFVKKRHFVASMRRQKIRLKRIFSQKTQSLSSKNGLFFFLNFWENHIIVKTIKKAPPYFFFRTSTGPSLRASYILVYVRKVKGAVIGIIWKPTQILHSLMIKTKKMDSEKKKNVRFLIFFFLRYACQERF